MAWVKGNDLTTAANFLLRFLDREVSAPYSRFESGSASGHLAELLDLSQRHPPPAMVLLLAAYSLRRRGLVRFGDLPTTLADGEPDIQFSITAAGRRFVSAGEHVELPGFRL